MRRADIANPTIDIHDIENRLWASADELRANSGLKESEYSVPMLGLIFLKYADNRFSVREAELAGGGSGRRTIGKQYYQEQGVMYLPDQARFGHLLNLPEGANLGQAVNDAMKAIEEANEDLRGVLPSQVLHLFGVAHLPTVEPTRVPGWVPPQATTNSILGP